MLPVLAGVMIAFNAIMEKLEAKWALSDLQVQSRVVYSAFQDPILKSVTQGKFKNLHRVYRKMNAHPNLVGLFVCSKNGKLISKSNGVPRSVKCLDEKKFNQNVEAWSKETLVAESDKKDGETNGNGNGIDLQKVPVFNQMIQGEANQLHQSIFPLIDKKYKLRAFLVALHDPTYLNQRGEITRRYAYYAFIILGLFISIITLIVYRWSFSKPVDQMTEVMKGVLTGDTHRITTVLEGSELAPLVKDFDEVLVQLRDAQANQDELNSPIWNGPRLNQEMERLFGESRLCVISNDEPYIHDKKRFAVEVHAPASGMVTGIEPILRSCSGIWIGHGSGSADRETADKAGMILVPPEKPRYALKRVWLSKEEEEGYYHGFSNEGLWPLCHIAHVRPNFKSEDWDQYVSVNAKFAQAFNEEVKTPKPVTMIQGHHFALLPSMIKKMRPDARVGMFWQMPWPNPESIRICPWRIDLLQGILGADLLCFHLQYHCNNFLDSVERFLEARVSRNNFTVTIQGHTTHIKAIPLGVDWSSQLEVTKSQIPEIRSQVFDELMIPSESILGIGVDRLDYTKGIVEKFLAVEKLIEDNPSLIGKLVFLQVVSPSKKMHLKRYQEVYAEIQKEAERINWRFYSAGYQPIQLKFDDYPREKIFNYFRSADFCYVSSLHEGMNLVSKEFVASRVDLKGVLVLSSFTGAARELTDALIVNPYDIEECAMNIKRAIQMSEDEQSDRLKKLREVVSTNNVYQFGAKFFKELHKANQS